MPRLQLIIVWFVAAVWAVIAQAGELPAPSGDVILTVTGNIENTNADDMAEFDLAMLEELGGDEIATTTIWTKGVQDFTGVYLSNLLDTLGVTEGTIRAMAINDYAVEIPMEDAVQGGAMIAYLRNGDPMPTRDKGPLWVVYPFDRGGRYQTEVYYSRSIWQLDRLQIVE